MARAAGSCSCCLPGQRMAVVLDGDAGDELADPTAGQAENARPWPAGSAAPPPRPTPRRSPGPPAPHRPAPLTRLARWWPHVPRGLVDAHVPFVWAALFYDGTRQPRPGAAVALLFLLRAGVADLDRALVGELAVVVLVLVLVLVLHAGSFQEPGGQCVSLSFAPWRVDALAVAVVIWGLRGCWVSREVVWRDGGQRRSRQRCRAAPRQRSSPDRRRRRW